MSKFQDLKDLFKQRLLAAATRRGSEEERKRKLLVVIFTPGTKQQGVFPADVQQLSVNEEESLEQEERSTSLDQGDTKPPLIKEEQEELWSRQEGEQNPGLKGADNTEFSFNPVPVKRKDDEEEPPSSQMETEADGEDCEGSEPVRSSDLEGHLQSETEVKIEDSSEQMTPNMNNKSHSCSQCGKTFDRNWYLSKHMATHTGEKPFSCPTCGSRFAQKYRLTQHMIIHTGEKPFSCSECGEGFTQKGSLKRHMILHTGEKPFCCPTCGKSYTQKGHLTQHMVVHTGEKAFSCSVCGKRFTQKKYVRKHMAHHRGEKAFIIQSV